MDYRLAEYSRLLPFEYLYNKEMGGKRLIKDILYGIIPKQILDRPKKGFAPPINQWFKHDLRYVMEECINEYILKKTLPDLNPQKMIKLRDEFLKGKKIQALPFLKIYLYVLWYKKYCEEI